MRASLTSSLSLDEAKKQFIDLEVTDKSGAIVHQQGLFTQKINHVGIGSLFFADTNITSA